MKKIDFRVALPNLITIIGLCLGLNSLKLAFEGNFEKALIFNLLFRNKRSVAKKTRIIKVGKKLINVRKNDAARNKAQTKSMYAG